MLLRPYFGTGEAKGAHITSGQDYFLYGIRSLSYKLCANIGSGVNSGIIMHSEPSHSCSEMWHAVSIPLIAPYVGDTYSASSLSVSSSIVTLTSASFTPTKLPQRRLHSNINRCCFIQTLPPPMTFHKYIIDYEPVSVWVPSFEHVP